MRVLHMSGAGNDFMVMDARGQAPDFPQLAKKLCAMTHADGFMAIDYSEIADFRLHFYNSDGSRGEMCGNGARCICKFAHDLGMVGDTMTVQTDAGIVDGWYLAPERIRVKLNDPGVLDLQRREDAAYVELGSPGVPHSVTHIPGLLFEEKHQLREYALALRHDPVFPKGVNVNFYHWLGDAHVRVLTYERGVEDYTLACGTGCGSIASVLWARGELPGGVLTAENEGGTLTVTVSGENGNVTSLLLEGPAVVLNEYHL